MRLNIKISDDMNRKVDTYARLFGMSKSSFMAYCVGSHIRSLESQKEVVDSISTAITDKIKNSSDNDVQ